MGEQPDNTMDEVDKAFLASIVPPDAAMPQFLALACWIDPDGKLMWRVYNQTYDLSVSQVIGLMEMAKLNLLARSDANVGFLVDPAFRPDED